MVNVKICREGELTAAYVDGVLLLRDLPNKVVEAVQSEMDRRIESKGEWTP